jgi:DNA repair protein RadC
VILAWNGRWVKVEITTAEKAFETLRDKVSVDVEEFWALALGPKKTLLASRMIFRGTVDSCLVHPRDIFRFACLENASSLLVAHNHPSGDLVPSQEDLRFTRQLLRAAEVMEIPIVDHLILTTSSYASLRSDGWCRFDPRSVRSI